MGTHHPEAMPPAIEATVNPKRVRTVTGTQQPKPDGDCVIYWMSRDQRADDNWAMLHARQLALAQNLPLVVLFSLVPRFLSATIRQYGFMLRGLKETASTLRDKRIPFSVLNGWAKDTIPKFAREANAAAVVCDMSPLRVPAGWVGDVAGSLDKINIPLVQVDAHNVVPVWEASPKLEYAARTIRPKITSHLPEFLTDFPELEPNPAGDLDLAILKDHLLGSPADDDGWTKLMASLEVDRTVEEVDWATAGAAAGAANLDAFCTDRFHMFAALRNDPNEAACSDMSPWLHFGQVSAQRMILTVKSTVKNKSTAEFVEEAIVRSELADNFCFYNPHYDSLEGASDWARKSLELHSTDKREYLYTYEQLESGQTHDDLWNAAQLQMVTEGKMHGFLRMYWAKKILEWSPDPATALKWCLELNDRFELDGRDPNGYVGCAWSIMGIHDMGWTERPIFGKIRFMNYAGCCRKMDVPAFVARYPPAAQNCTAAGGVPAAPKKARAKAKPKPKGVKRKKPA